MSVCLRLFFASILVSAVACGKSDSKSGPPAASPNADDTGGTAATAPAKKPAVEPDAEDELDPDSIAWTQHTMEEVGVSVPTIDGVDVRASTMNTNTYVMQMKKPIRAAFWLGKGRTVESWRERYENNDRFELSEPTKVTICGVPGVRQSLSIPEGRMQVGYARSEDLPPDMAMAGGDGQAPTPPANGEAPAKPVWKKNPATFTTVVGFKRRGSDVIASWTVETDKREAFRAAEEAYFAGILCD